MLVSYYHNPFLEHVLRLFHVEAVFGKLIDKSELCGGLQHRGREVVLSFLSTVEIQILPFHNDTCVKLSWMFCWSISIECTAGGSAFSLHCSTNEYDNGTCGGGGCNDDSDRWWWL